MNRPAAGPVCQLAVVGGGWAGLAAAVRATEAGAAVTLFEMAPQLGGRARSVVTRAGALDNGQHILIGAYRRTLALMQTVGADARSLLLRGPLHLCDPQGQGLVLPPGPPLLAFARGVWAAHHWRRGERLALLGAAGGWLLKGFRCPATLTVAELCGGLPASVRRDLLEPLCVAALNTPMDSASAGVFLRVLKDALFSGTGSADLLLPRQPLSALLPDPALAWLRARGAQVATGRRVRELQPLPDRKWRLEGQCFDAVILACSATEAARLSQPLSSDWSARAAALRYEPIVTAYLHDPGLRFPVPLVALAADDQAPAQYAFDLGALGHAPGLFAFVVSGARSWVDRGLAATGEAIRRQARRAFPGAFGATDVVRHIAAEHRATFACTPGLDRPQALIAPGLVAAGDYVKGPYPATLEGAVRAGEAAAALVLRP